MTQLNSVQQEIIRTRPQQTQLKLSIFQPRTVLACQVNNADAQKGDQIIPFDSVSAGSYLNVEAGMTLLVGTIPGARDAGKIRIRSVTSSQFVVSENSNIVWANNLYLTVLRYWEVWPIYPRIINDPNNPENVIFYKDYDVVYSNQNSILGTFVTAGPNRAVDIVGANAQIYYSSTGTYSLVGDTIAHEWFFEGGSPTGSLSAEPGYVSYPTSGHYVTRHTVSGTNGSIDITYRYVSIYNDANPPIQLWNMASLDGSRSEGGHRVSITVRENITINENDVVVLYSDDWYGDTNQSFGGNYPNNEKIFFSGYVIKGTIRYNYKESSVSFDVGSITDVMKQSQGFSVSVESKALPLTWYEILDLDVRRALYHYLKWHTTVLSLADMQFVGADQKIQYFDADRASMYDAIDNLMRGTLVGKVVADRQGKIWAEVDARAYSNPTGSFPSTMTITSRDWMNKPNVEEVFADEYSYVEMGGIQYSGVVTGTYQAFMACAPGSAPSFRGRIEKMQGLALESQSQINQLAGNVFANHNSRFPSVDMQMAGNLRNLDIAPQETNRLVIHTDDTVAGIEIDRLYIPETVGWMYDPKNKIMLPNVIYNNVVSGNSGEAIIIPASPNDGALNSGYGIPGLRVPPLPTLTWPPYLSDLIATGTSSALAALALDYCAVNYNMALTVTQRGSALVYNSSSINDSTSWIQIDVNLPGLYLLFVNFSHAFVNGRVGELVTDDLTAGAVLQSFSTALDENGNGRISGGLSQVIYKPAASTFMTVITQESWPAADKTITNFSVFAVRISG